jgi:thymidylate kinase
MKNRCNPQQDINMSRRQIYPFICLIGIDGSGKTAHARSLAKELSKIGVNCVHISPRSSLLQYMPVILRNWIDKHAHLGPRNLTLPRLGVKESAGSRSIILLKMSICLIFIIYAFLTYLITIRPHLGKYVVVSDRYFYDLFYNLWGRKSYLLIGLLPRPSLGFILDLPVTTAFSRMHSLEDRMVPQKYYESLRHYYLNIARCNNFLIIDTSNDFEESRKCILEHVKTFLESRGKCDP